MATNATTNAATHGNSHTNGSTLSHEKSAQNMSPEERTTAENAARFGYGPLAKVETSGARLPAFGGEFQPGLYRPVAQRKFANPAPLGLSAFALTTFVLSLINVGAEGIEEPNLVLAIAYGYGGFVQLLAGMWEMAVGNTFGATALSSYGGFWLSFAIILTPGGFQVVESLTAADGSESKFYDSFGLYLFGWFIFTTILLVCTLKSTVAFFLLFFFLDLAFLMLGIAYLNRDGTGHPRPSCVKAGGYFGLFAAFMAWYNAIAGIADNSNSFFIIPVAHFPWSEKAREARQKTEHTA